MPDICAYGDDKCPILGGPREGCTYCTNAKTGEDETVPLLQAQSISFEQARDGAADDLKAVAELFSAAEANVRKGDLDEAVNIIDRMRDWRQYLLVRHAHRLECLEAGRADKPAH